MSTKEIRSVITDLTDEIRTSEQNMDCITHCNAAYIRDIAIDEIESRELPLADKQVEDFMESQANARDREYALEQLSKWDGHYAIP